MKKILPFISVFLYIVALVFYVLYEKRQNYVLQYFYWIFCNLANVTTLFYIVISVKIRQGKTEDGVVPRIDPKD